MREQLNAYLAGDSLQSVLWLGNEANPAPTLPNTEIRFLAIRANMLDDIGDQHFDCAVLEDLPGPLTQAEAVALVAHLRDVEAQRLLWVLGTDAPWARQDLLALGFRELDVGQDGSRLFGFDIENYKATPDWLNPKNWANPERWNKKRW